MTSYRTPLNISTGHRTTVDTSSVTSAAQVFCSEHTELERDLVLGEGRRRPGSTVHRFRISSRDDRYTMPDRTHLSPRPQIFCMFIISSYTSIYTKLINRTLHCLIIHLDALKFIEAEQGNPSEPLEVFLAADGPGNNDQT